MPTIRITKIPYLSLKRGEDGLKTEAKASFGFSYYGDASYDQLFTLLRKNKIEETGPMPGEVL